MTGYDIIKEMRHARSGEYCFIKWWRKENDFADYELVDTFLANLKPEDNFAGFELLTLERMWHGLHHLIPRRVRLGTRFGEPVIRWQHMDRHDGTMREEVFPFDAPSVMTVFEGETHGDTLC